MVQIRTDVVRFLYTTNSSCLLAGTFFLAGKYNTLKYLSGTIPIFLFGKDAEPGKRRGGSYRIPGQGTFFHTEEFEACRFCGADLALNFNKSSLE